jgi:transposase
MNEKRKLQEKFEKILPHLTERQRRLYLSAEAQYFGHGGITQVAKASGVSRVTLTKGIQELEQQTTLPEARSRRRGGGRKKEIDRHSSLIRAVEKLMDPVTRGDPESPLLWTSKSLRKLSEELQSQGYSISYRGVGEILKFQGYSLQANRKRDEGKQHPDRDAQFQHIHKKVLEFQRGNHPVISVDTKKKELIGNFKNLGREWTLKSEAREVNVYDFLSQAEGKAIPYGVYDICQNAGWVSVGTDKDTAEFAVATIRNWWKSMGCGTYPTATRLLITADCGGSNGSRVRLWKKALQDFADETGLAVSVCHFPPGTSKWNKIEHRLFSFITKNWRGKPLISYEVVVNLIAYTTTQKGLKVTCQLDTNSYQKGVKVSDEEFARIRLKKDDFHGEWNYIILPNTN